MCRSLSWSLRIKCRMLCCKSCSILFLFNWIYWQSLRWVSSNSNMYVVSQKKKNNEKDLDYFANFSHMLSTVPDVPTNPCIPSPCGPYSQCREVNDRAICACIDNYIGSPPACRPECSLSSECFLDKACINLKCVDPCPGACGQNARCQVINHNPICSCSSGYVGDPFISCIPEESKLQLIECINFIDQIFIWK